MIRAIIDFIIGLFKKKPQVQPKSLESLVEKKENIKTELVKIEKQKEEVAKSDDLSEEEIKKLFNVKE